MKTLLEKSLNNDSVTGKGAACLGEPYRNLPGRSTRWDWGEEAQTARLTWWKALGGLLASSQVRIESLPMTAVTETRQGLVALCLTSFWPYTHSPEGLLAWLW